LKIINVINVSVILLFVFTGLSFGQIEDALLFGEEEEQVEEEICVPETLASNYDHFKDLEISLMELRQLYSFGSEYFKNKSYNSALPYLWKVFLNDTTTKYARHAIRKIADSYFNLQMADSTLIASYRGLALFPDQTRLHYYAGYIQENLGKFTCAIPHYEALVDSDPENEKYLEKLAFLYFKNKDIKAIEVQKKLVALKPENSTYIETLAIYTRGLLGDGEELLKAYKNAYEADPDNIDNAYNYGKTALDQGEYLTALEPLSKIVEKLDTKNAKAFKARAVCYEVLERYTSAINDYKQIIDIEPQNAEIMCAIANVYRYKNEFTNGRYWINKALNTKPGFGLAYITLGEIYESAVLFCQKGRDRKYDDGLVYEMAYAQYGKALNDPAYSSMAKSRRNGLRPFVLTKEEKFMNQNRTELKLPCYTSWIK
jgi:tetratricopeptide (TPR) repeat protein